MNLLDLFVIAVGLSMDAFAVSIAKGLSLKKYALKYSLLAGLYFGIFQALMPLIGFFLGAHFQKRIQAFDHWIAFILLFIIGINMFKESFKKEKSENSDFSFRKMFALGIATSIDALALGVSFACLQVQILFAALVIGLTTFTFSGSGVFLAASLKLKIGHIATRFGGILLIILGVKILIEHSFFQ